MIKVYKCVSEISFNLKINGNKRRIIFEPMSGGKSQYRTSERAVQEGIEKLDQFGSIIHLTEKIKEECDGVEDDGPVEDGAEESLGENNDLKDDNGEEATNSTGKDIQENISSFAEAKEYLLTKGCDKTIRSKENILIYGQELGIEFPNLK